MAVDHNTAPGILHLVTTLGAGGGELQLIQNLRNFDTSRFDHQLVYIRPPAVLLPQVEDSGVRVTCLDESGTASFVRRLTRLFRLVRRDRIRLIHTTNAEADKLGAAVGKLTRVPVAATLNAVAYSDEWFRTYSGLNSWKLRYMKYSRMLTLRLGVSRYNAVSNVARQSFVDALGLSPDRIDVIYRSVDTSRFSPGARQARNTETQEGYPLLVTVGRLVGEKGHRYLIDAMPAVLREYPGAKLLVAGDGDLRGSLEKQIASLGLGDSVRLLGYQADIPALLARADIFALPSISEGCPNALLEAMAMGLPCIAAKSDAVGEVATDGETALLARVGDPAALSEAILRLAADRDLAARTGAAAAEHVSERFCPSRSVSALESLYTRMLQLPERLPIGNS